MPGSVGGWLVVVALTALALAAVLALVLALLRRYFAMRSITAIALMAVGTPCVELVLAHLFELRTSEMRGETAAVAVVAIVVLGVLHALQEWLEARKGRRSGILHSPAKLERLLTLHFKCGQKTPETAAELGVEVEEVWDALTAIARIEARCGRLARAAQREGEKERKAGSPSRGKRAGRFGNSQPPRPPSL